MDEIGLGVLEKRLQQASDLGPEHRELLQRALGFYEEFTRVNRDNATLEREIGHAYRRVADINNMLGQDTAADTGYRQAIAFLENRITDSPGEPEFRKELVVCFHHLAVLGGARLSAQEMEDCYRRAIALDQHLAEEFPEVPDHRGTLACVYNDFGPWLYGPRKRIGRL